MILSLLDNPFVSDDKAGVDTSAFVSRIRRQRELLAAILIFNYVTLLLEIIKHSKQTIVPVLIVLNVVFMMLVTKINQRVWNANGEWGSGLRQTIVMQV